MALRTIDKRLFRLIRDTTGQFVSVTMALAIGLALYISTGIAALNMDAAMRRYYQDRRFADMAVTVTSMSERQTAALADMEGVESAEGRVSRTVPFVTDDKRERARMLLLTLTEDINLVSLESGQFPAEGRREVLVIKQFAEARGITPGSEIGLQIGGRVMDFYVSGLVSSPEFVYLVDPRQGLMPDNMNYGVAFFERGLGAQIMGRDGFNEILVTVERNISGRKLDDLAEALEERLERVGGRSVEKRENQISDAMLSDEIEQLKAASHGIPLLFLAISGLIIAMMLARMVKRDRQSIGVMKALGYSSWDLIFHYAKYSLISALIGGAAGMLAGLPMAAAMTDYYMTFYNLPVLDGIASYAPVADALAMAFSCCAAAGFAGARGILRLSPAEAMRSEAPKKGGRVWLEYVTPVWANMSFSRKMAVKNVFRSKKRAFFSAFAVAITFSLIVFTLAMPAAIDAMMGEGLSEFQPMDYDVSFENPMSRKAVSGIKARLEDMSGLEGKIDMPFKISSGTRDISLPLLGVERDTVFYRFRDKEGNPLPFPRDGILLSDYAAKKLDVGVGDSVKLHSYLYDKDDRWAAVSGIVYRALGTRAYADMDYLARNFLEPGAVTGCFLDSADPDAGRRLMELPAVASVASVRGARAVLKTYTRMINAFLAILVVLSGLLGGIVIYSVAVINIGERETEFSTLMVQGMSRWEIFSLLLRENNVVTVL
ncbi:MAG: ABC transporter permease, partial [Synergistaceae bacterium]|nr:ABC transporter permease [Synergistaceae bacterium]